MSTWADLRKKTFSLLDLPRETTGDVKESIDESLFDVYQDMVADVLPDELFVSTDPVALSYPAESLSIASDFGVSNLREIFAVTVNTDPDTDGSEYYPWEEWSWQKWLKKAGYLPDRVWSKSPDGRIYFSQFPGDGDSDYNAILHYYKTAAAFSDAGSPEIDSVHHHIISFGAAAQYPHYFSGEREQLFIKIQSRFNRGVERFLEKSRRSRSLRQIRGRSSKSNSYGINWG